MKTNEEIAQAVKQDGIKDYTGNAVETGQGNAEETAVTNKGRRRGISGGVDEDHIAEIASEDELEDFEGGGKKEQSLLELETSLKIVEKANEWLDVPYDPNGGHTREGVDCSHLVHEVYEEIGLSYPYASSREFTVKAASYFQKVNIPREGNVVLYKGHMGIYTEGKIISAQSGAGKVTLGELNWFKDFIGYYRYKY